MFTVDKSEKSMEKPLADYFLCPMSHDIMLDPVILPSGYTFERRTIQRWIDGGNRFCPITNLPLPDPVVLIPNRILRTLISKFAPTQLDSTSPSPSQLVPTVPTLNSEADSPSQLAPLVAKLNSAETWNRKITSLSQLGAELKANPRLRGQIPKSGAIAAILQCVNSDYSVLNSTAISLLLKLIRDNDDNIKSAVVAEGALPKLVATVCGGDSAVIIAAAGAITYLCFSRSISNTIGGYPGAIRSLISLLKHDNRKVRLSVAAALFAICYLPENRRRTVDCEAIPALLNCIRAGLTRSNRDEKEGQVDCELAVLGLLSRSQEGREELLARDKEVVDILVGYLKKSGTHGDSVGVYYGVFVLDLMCCLSEKVKDLMKIKGGLEICLGLVSGYDKKVSKICLNLAKFLM